MNLESSSALSLTELAASTTLPAGWLEDRARDGTIPHGKNGAQWRFDEHQARLALVRHFAVGRGDLSGGGLLLTRERLAEALGLPVGLIDRLTRDGVLPVVAIPGAPRYDLLDSLDALRRVYGVCIASKRHAAREICTIRQFARQTFIRRDGLDALIDLGLFPHWRTQAGQVFVDPDYCGWYLSSLSMAYPVMWSGAGAEWAKAIDQKIRANDPPPKRRTRTARKIFRTPPPPIDTESDDLATPSDGRAE